MLSDVLKKKAWIQVRKNVRMNNLNSVATHINTWVKNWPGSPAPTNVIRVSQLHSLCAREFVFNYWSPIPKQEFDFTSRIRMGVGTFLHTFLQDCVLGPLGVLRGDWVSVGDEVHGYHPDPDKTLQEIADRVKVSWTYREPIVYDGRLRLSGHVDGIVSDRILALDNVGEVLGKEELLLEIKTCGSRVMDKLNSPEDIPNYYKCQAVAYQQLMGVRKTLFWFINRDTVESKLFIYEYEAKWWRDIERKLCIVWNAIKDRTLPVNCMACCTPKDSRAITCPFKDLCWVEWKNFEAWTRSCEEKKDRSYLDLSDDVFERLRKI